MNVHVFLGLLTLVFSGCTTANVGPNAEANRTQSLLLDAPPEEAYRRAVQVAAQYGWKITESDAAALFFTASAPGNMNRWGDELTIYIEPGEKGSRVTVRSGLGHRPNREHVAGYLERLSGRND